MQEIAAVKNLVHGILYYCFHNTDHTDEDDALQGYALRIFLYTVGNPKGMHASGHYKSGALPLK